MTNENPFTLMNRLLEEAGSDYRMPLPSSGDTYQSVLLSMMMAVAKLCEAKLGKDAG